MTLHARLAPAIAIAVVVLVCLLPWGIAPELRLVLALLPYVVIHHCVERRPDATPDWLVFLAGFATDVAGQGPLGFWSLIYLCGYTMVRSATADRSHGPLASTLLLIVTIVCLALMQWSVASIYYLRAMEIRPLLIQAPICVATYLILLLLFPARTEAPQPLNSRLERGRR